MEEKQEIVPVRTEETAKYYSEEKFWDKLKSLVKSGSKRCLCRTAFILHAAKA